MGTILEMEEEKLEVQKRILHSIEKETDKEKEKRDRDRKKKAEEEAAAERHKFQCIVLGAAALMIAGAAIIQEVSQNVDKPVSSEYKIQTADSADEGEEDAASTGGDTLAGLDTWNYSGESTGAAGIGEGVLILVNKEYALPEDYEVELHWLQNGRVAVAEEMYDALREMLTDGSEDGREFVVASGYRSDETQQELLEEDILAAMEQYGMSWEEAYELESRETMPSGHSEHATGLAVDIVALDYQILDGAQEYTEENQWLREHCQNYGFILRYPAGKEDITGISYESWHFRYVGREAAEEIMERGITLEEYLGAAE